MIYKYLDQSDIEKLTIEVGKLGHMESEGGGGYWMEFYKLCLTQKGGNRRRVRICQNGFGKGIWRGNPRRAFCPRFPNLCKTVHLVFKEK